MSAGTLPLNASSKIKVLKMNGTRFQVIQRRGNYGEPRESFNRNWDEYKYGFGSPEKEFWLGNENIHMLTRSNDYELRIDLEDFEGNTR